MKNTSRTYKMRAECSLDIIKFISKMDDGLKDFSMERWEDENGIPFPDVDFTFTCWEDPGLDNIKKIIYEIEDGHVMVETVQPLELYTGER